MLYATGEDVDHSHGWHMTRVHVFFREGSFVASRRSEMYGNTDFLDLEGHRILQLRRAAGAGLGDQRAEPRRAALLAGAARTLPPPPPPPLPALAASDPAPAPDAFTYF
ncbi:Protein of unknown function [Gryllus bimaculatus]|nr:Protein of unknown function [Gryllus bimaculatus]